MFALLSQQVSRPPLSPTVTPRRAVRWLTNVTAQTRSGDSTTLVVSRCHALGLIDNNGERQLRFFLIYHAARARRC